MAGKLTQTFNSTKKENIFLKITLGAMEMQTTLKQEKRAKEFAKIFDVILCSMHELALILY